ncbi:MAG: dienelactone hydrolase [Planctomycetota bacterium]
MNAFSTIPFELVDKLNPERIVRGRVTLPDLSTPVPFVLLIHGHRSFMDWAFMPLIANRLAAAGLASVAFNMSGSGIGPDLDHFTELEAFAKNTYSQELEDIERVQAEVNSGRFPGVDPARGGIFGHSRGGGMALLHAARRGSFSALCLWAPMHRVALFGKESRALFEERGFIDSPIGGGRTLRLDRDIIDDAHNHRDQLNIAAACAKIQSQTLLLYGDHDPLHTKGGGTELQRAFKSITPEVGVVEHTGHTFGARHPLRGVPDPLEQALSLTIDWFTTHLS